MTSLLPHPGPSQSQFCFRSRCCIDTEAHIHLFHICWVPTMSQTLYWLTEVQWCTKKDTWTIHPILYHFFSCHPCLLVILCFLTEEMSFSFKHTTLVFFSHALVRLFLCRASYRGTVIWSLQWWDLQYYGSPCPSLLCYWPHPRDCWWRAMKTQFWRRAALLAGIRRKSRFVLSIVHWNFHTNNLIVSSVNIIEVMASLNSGQERLLWINSFQSLAFPHKEFWYQVFKCLFSHCLFAWELKKSGKEQR